MKHPASAVIPSLINSPANAAGAAEPTVATAQDAMASATGSSRPRTPAPAQTPLPEDTASLAALAAQGSAAAFASLSARCQIGAPHARIAALQFLPTLVPVHPVGLVLAAVDRPGTPPLVRRALAEVRGRLPDTREREPAYREGQRARVSGFLRAERQRLIAGPLRGQGRLVYLRLAGAVVSRFYDYRFAEGDGVLGGIRAEHIEEFLLDFAPRHLLLPVADRLRAPKILGRHLAWLSQTDLAMPAEARLAVQRCYTLIGRYAKALRGPQPGSHRAALGSAQSDGVDAADPQALERHLALHRLDLNDELLPIWDS